MIHLKQYRRPLLAGLVLSIVLSGCGAASTPSQGGASSPVGTQPSAVATQPTTQPTASSAPQPSAVATQPSPAASSAPTPQPANDQVAAPVQTVLDYYAALNQQHYDQAYSYWANGGAASGQTLEQFSQGFADTVQISVLVNTPKLGQGGAGSVTVPLAIYSVINAPNSPTSAQAFRSFGGSYTLVPAAGSTASTTGWQISSASIRDLPEGTRPAADYDDPAALVRAYYDAINTDDFARAYTDWDTNGQSSQQSYAQFVQGFAATSQVAIQIGTVNSGAGAGNLYATVPLIINATSADGTQQTFCGSYQLHRANIPPWDQLGWRLQTAQIAPHAAVQLDSEQANQLLSNNCQ